MKDLSITYQLVLIYFALRSKHGLDHELVFVLLQGVVFKRL